MMVCGRKQINFGHVNITSFLGVYIGGVVKIGVPVPTFHEESFGATPESIAPTVLLLEASECDGGRILVAYSKRDKYKCIHT